MGYVNNVKRAIHNALSNFDHSVYYTKGHGSYSSYFTIEINEEWDWDWIENQIDEVCDDYGLWIDDDSEGDFDLVVSEY